MVGSEIPDFLANSFWSHRNSIRAARTCSLVIAEFSNWPSDKNLIPQVLTGRWLELILQVSNLIDPERLKMEKMETKRTLREDLTPEERQKAERIGSIEFKSAGATRKR